MTRKDSQILLSPNLPDVLVCNEGTAFLFRPLTPRASIGSLSTLRQMQRGSGICV